MGGIPRPHGDGCTCEILALQPIALEAQAYRVINRDGSRLAVAFTVWVQGPDGLVPTTYLVDKDDLGHVEDVLNAARAELIEDELGAKVTDTLTVIKERVI